MRTVFPTYEVAHIWASQSQSEGTNRQRNLGFTGDTIFSYGHYRIARIIGRAVLIQENTYSATTAGHIWHARRAVSHLEQFTVPNVSDSRDTHARNLQWFCDHLDRLRLEQLNKRNRRSRLPGILETMRTLARYVEVFKCRKDLPRTHRKLVRAVEVSTDLETVAAQFLGETGAEIVAAQKRRDARQAKLNAKRRAEELKRLEAQRLERLELAAAELELWRRHQFGIAPRHYLQELPPALRLSADGENVETSHGARVPVEDARRAWPIVLELRRRGRQQSEDLETIGAFRFAGVSDDALVIGCHRIPMVEVERIAQELGLLEVVRPQRRVLQIA